MKNVLKLGLFGIVIGFLSSCTSLHQTMKEPNVFVELEKNDFELSDQVTGEATSNEFLFIDWSRLFNVESASTSGGAGISVSSIPVIGGFVSSKAQGYALYELMKANPGYDVVFYPQFETIVEKPIGIGLIKTTKVKVTARLGKLKK